MSGSMLSLMARWLFPLALLALHAPMAHADGRPLPREQAETVHAYVDRTRAWPRTDYVMREIRPDLARGELDRPTFLIEWSGTRPDEEVTEVDKRFLVFLDTRTGQVVGEDGLHPRAPREDRSATADAHAPHSGDMQ